VLSAKRIRGLTQALMFSGALNVVTLSLFLYWMLRERPPTPYCESKPASLEQQQIPLADQRGWAEVMESLSKLSFAHLVDLLTHTQLIENGYAERDVALACLIAFHHFDVYRALPKEPKLHQRRLMLWQPKGRELSVPLIVYPDLTQEQFDAIIQFARTERWPLTAEGLFLFLHKQKELDKVEESLIETFILTPEFWTVEVLFKRSGQPPNKMELLRLLLEGNWRLLKTFVDQQRALHDSSDARRQRLLLDYLQAGSSTAALLLLKMEWEFSVKKLDDLQVLAIIKLMPAEAPESGRFAKEMLRSPRSTQVWQQASQWLYAQAGESAPTKWSYAVVAARFLAEKGGLSPARKVESPPGLPKGGGSTLKKKS